MQNKLKTFFNTSSSWFESGQFWLGKIWCLWMSNYPSQRKLMFHTSKFDSILLKDKGRLRRSNRKVRSCSICVSLRRRKITVMHADIMTSFGSWTLTETVIVLLLSIILLGLFDLVVLLMAMLFLIVFLLRWHSLVRRRFSFLVCFLFMSSF